MTSKRFTSQSRRAASHSRSKGRLPKGVKLPPSERASLRRTGANLGDLDLFDPAELHDRTGIALERCEFLVSIVRFQRLKSVGPETAMDLYRLGMRTLDDLVDADPLALFERLKVLSQSALDPCVEDSLRCAIAQATYDDLPPELRTWWGYSTQRGLRRVEIRPAHRGADRSQDSAEGELI